MGEVTENLILLVFDLFQLNNSVKENSKKSRQLKHRINSTN